MSGAKNCPETPRQKMIGMMYLVLTAMLALNVSSDVLNGFSLVEDSLLRTTANASASNEALYKDLQEQVVRMCRRLNSRICIFWIYRSICLRTVSDTAPKIIAKNSEATFPRIKPIH